MKTNYIIEFPVTFRTIIPTDHREVMFEAKSWDEFYMTIQDVCLAVPMPKEQGQKMLCAILDQKEQTKIDKLLVIPKK